MIFSKIVLKACCGKTSISFIFEKTLSYDFITILTQNSFTELKKYTQSGMIYLENNGIIITGLLNSNKLQLHCKKSNCEEFINNFESLLLNLEI